MSLDINKLTEVFNKFSGKEIDVVEVKGNNKYGFTYKDFSADKTINELRSAVEEMGLRLRVWLPDSVGTMDYRENRVNVHVSKDADGKYRIGSRFKIG